MTFMIPNTSVRPADSRNSSALYCKPLSSCSKSISMSKPPGLLHLALADVRIGVIARDDPHVLVDQLARAVVLDVQQVPVLNGVVVGGELEVAAHGGKVGLLQRRAEGVRLACDIAADRLERRGDQVGCVVGLGGID